MINSDSDINLIIFFHVYINGDLNLIILTKPVWSHQNICQFISWSIKLRGNPQETYLCQRQTLHSYRFGNGRTSLGIYKTCVRDKPNKAAEVEMGMCQRQNQQPAIWKMGELHSTYKTCVKEETSPTKSPNWKWKLHFL